MSRKYCDHEVGLFDGFGIGSRKPTLPSLIILILIILQFSRNDFAGFKGTGSLAGFGGEDNGILFIIAIFYLSCCNACHKTC